MRVSAAPWVVEILEVYPEYEGAFSGQVLFMLEPERNRLEWRKLIPHNRKLAAAINTLRPRDITQA